MVGTGGFKGNARVLLPGMTACIDFTLELYLLPVRDKGKAQLYGLTETDPVQFVVSKMNLSL